MPKKKKIKAKYLAGDVLTEDSDEARELYNQSRYGMITDSNTVKLSLLESLYLLDKGKIDILTQRSSKMKKETLLKKAVSLEPNFSVKYAVFKDMRDRGYIIKTALKFGADFRVYDRGFKPGEAHAKWVVYPVKESSTLTWHDFSAKNRVAHSTKKRLLIGVVDEEQDVTYYEIKWTRP